MIDVGSATNCWGPANESPRKHKILRITLSGQTPKRAPTARGRYACADWAAVRRSGVDTKVLLVPPPCFSFR